VTGSSPSFRRDERVHRAALDRARADQRHLDRQVVEAARAEPGQRAHLGPALHLEHPDRVGQAELVVDAGLLFGDGVEVPVLAEVLADRVHRILQGGEHAEAEQVELDQAHPGAVVLVPLQDGPVLHPGVLDRHHLADGPVGQHHAAGVDAEVAGELQQLLRQLDHRGRDVVVDAAADRPPRVDLFGPGVLLPGRVAERLGHVADRELGPVGDHVRDLGGVAPAVLAVDVLDHLLAAVGVEVDVDVGLLVAGRGQEPLERQVVEDRVDGGDAEGVADHRVGRRSPTLAEDAAALRELDEVADDQEVSGKVEALDHRQLALDPVRRLLLVLLPGVLLTDAVLAELPEPFHRRVSRRHLLAGQLRFCLPQAERQLLGQPHRSGHRSVVPPEPGRHLRSRPEMGRPGRRQPAVHRIQPAPGPDGGDRRSQPVPPGHRIMHVVGRDDRQPRLGREPGQYVVAGGVPRIPVVDQLDYDPLPTEQRDEPVQFPGRGRRSLCRTTQLQSPADQALPAACQHQPVVLPHHGQVFQVVDGTALLLAAELRLGDGPGEPVVPLLALRQHQQVAALRIGDAVLGLGQVQRQLRTEDGAQIAVRLGGLGHPDHAVEAVVVGQREGVQPQPDRLLDQLLRGGGAVEEAVERVAVQLGIGHHRTFWPAGLQDRVWRVRRARPRPGGPVPTVGVQRCRTGRAGPVRQFPLQLRPRDGRVVPAHQRGSVRSDLTLP
jgi:hypothetical protein